MRYLLIALLCTLLEVSLPAETIGNVKYELPKGWKVANELNSCVVTNSKTIIYVPENSTREDSQEFFSVHMNSLPSISLDQASLEKMLQIQFPKKEVYVKILENTPETLLYEWGIKKEDQEALHGIARIFSTYSGVRILSYQTEHVTQFENLRPQWTEILNGASEEKAQS